MSGATQTTVEDQFFLRIALKNGLLTAEQAAAIEHSLAPGQQVEALVLERRLLDQGAVDRIRTAMAASQVMRLDALYAELLLERALVPPHIIEAAFREQRRQQYRVRVGNLLVGRRLLAPEVHREVISEVIRRLRSLGQDAYSSANRKGIGPGSGVGSGVGTEQTTADADPFGASSIEQSPLAQRSPPRSDDHMPHGLQSGPGTQQSPLRESPFASRRLDPAGLGGDSSTGSFHGAEGGPFAPPSGSPASSAGSGPIRIPLDETQAALPQLDYQRSSALFEPAARRLLREELHDDLTRSAIRIDLDGEGFDIKADAELLRSDLRDSIDRLADGEDSFVLDRGDLTDDGFEPEEYLKRKQTRGRLLIVAGGLALLGVLGLVGTAASQVYANRNRLDQVRELVQEANDASDPVARQEALERAEEALNRVGRTGVSASDKEALGAAIRWGLLRAEAEGALAAGKPRDGLELLKKQADSIGGPHREEYEQLVARCQREELIAKGRGAEKDEDWSLAASSYREAIKHGDPGSVANNSLARLQTTLRKQRDEARERLRASLSRKDEAHFNGLQRLLGELFGEPPDVSLDLNGLRRKRRREKVLASAKGHLNQIEQLERVRGELAELIREKADRELEDVLQSIETQLRVRNLETEGRRAEQRGQLRAAIDAYRAASKEAAPGVQRQLQNAIKRCEERLQVQELRDKALAKREAAVKFLREGRAEQAEEILAETAGAGDAHSKLLLSFARKVRGCAYVPAGPFRMGKTGGAPEESPEHGSQTGAFYMSRTEVTNAEYDAFLDSRAPETRKAWTPRHWTQPRRQEDGEMRGKIYPTAIRTHPVVYVDWTQASAYARWRGGRLPTEEEWEKAARGTEGQTFPWGEGSRSRVQVQVRTTGGRAPTAPVGALADDKSPYGVYDMAGNVHEWTASEFRPYPDAPSGVQARGGRKVLRGGAWRWPLEEARTTRRQSAKPDYQNDQIGFRYVIDIPEELKELR